MLLRSFLLSRKKTTANIAKKRLQIIVAERRKEDHEPQYLPQMKRELLEVICKYVTIDPDMLSIQLEKKDEYISILELYIQISEIQESVK